MSVTVRTGSVPPPVEFEIEHPLPGEKPVRKVFENLIGSMPVTDRSEDARLGIEDRWPEKISATHGITGYIRPGL